MSMFDFTEVNNIQEAGNSSKRLEANKIHKVVIGALTPELMETSKGPSNVLKIQFVGIEGDDTGAVYEHIVFEPKKENGDFDGKQFDDGSVGVAPVQELQALIRQFLTAVSPAYAEFIKGGGVEKYNTWLEWRAAVIKYATPAMNAKKPFEIKLFGRISEKDGKQYLNATLPRFFLGKKREGGLFTKSVFFGHNLSYSQKWEKDQIERNAAAAAAVPSDMNIIPEAASDASKALEQISL